MCVSNSTDFINKYLTKYQWSLIDSILLNPNITTRSRTKIQNILYKYYEQWAFTQAYKFKQLHTYKCKHISTLELNNYASLGLYKSLLKYNPSYKYPFIKYADIYIHSELINGLTELHPISSITKYERKKGYGQNKKYIKNTQWVGENEWIYDKIIKDKINENYPQNDLFVKHLYMSLWLKINEFDSFQKRITLLKYNFFFEKIKSNKEVAELMGCSEEWVRQNIKLVLSKLHLSDNNL
jgi:RNA polymerase sigma factor (sigma-70 family)